MTRILLIRHSNTELANLKLCGRLPGIPLSTEGVHRAEAVAKHLRQRTQLHAVCASPLQRAQETAVAIGRLQNLTVETDERLIEMNFGEWTGLEFDELEPLEAWRRYNRNRSLHAAPGGESLLQVQERAWASISEISQRNEGTTVAVVTHADVIRALLVLFLGMPLDQLLRLEIAPASLSEVLLGGDYPVVSCMNSLSSY